MSEIVSERVAESPCAGGARPRPAVPNAAEQTCGQTIFEQSRPGRRGVAVPAPGVPTRGLEALLPAWARREREPALPEVSELDVVRHYTRLSRKNFSIDTHFYPLGSCTMKYNPRIDEAIAQLPGLAHLHPYQEEAQIQGALALFWELEQLLKEITGPGLS